MAELTPEQLKETLDTAAQRAATAEGYRLPDGTQVNRAPLADVMAARREVKAELATKKRKGIFARIGFGRPQ